MTELLSKMTVTLLHAIKSSIQQGGLKDSLLTESEKALLEDMLKDGYFIKVQKGWWIFTRNYYHVTEKAREFFGSNKTKLHNLIGLIQKGISELEKKDKEAIKDKTRKILLDNDVTVKVFMLAYQVAFTDTYDSEEIGFCLKKDFNGWHNLQDEINEKGTKYFGGSQKRFIESPFAEDEPLVFFEDLLFWYLIIYDYIDYHTVEDIQYDFYPEEGVDSTGIEEEFIVDPVIDPEALVEQETERILFQDNSPAESTTNYTEESTIDTPSIDESKNYGSSYEESSYDSGSSFDSSFDSGDSSSFDD